MINDDVVSARTRALGGALEPVAGQVYFSPECHRGYEALGFSGSPTETNGVAMPDGAAYFCSRGSVLGQVPGEVVAAAFGVFNPAVVVPLVAEGWEHPTAEEIGAARTEGAIGPLARILGPRPDGLARVTELLRRANAPCDPRPRPLRWPARARPSRRSARRRLAVGRSAARVPGRRPRRGVERCGVRRH